MESTPLFLAAAVLGLAAAVTLTGHEAGTSSSATPRATLFQNVRIFDGKSASLSAPSHVLVRGNKIEKISATPISTDRSKDTTLIDGQGRTLMPGLIDAHVHLMMESISLSAGLNADISDVTLVAARAAEKQSSEGSPPSVTSVEPPSASRPPSTKGCTMARVSIRRVRPFPSPEVTGISARLTRCRKTVMPRSLTWRGLA